MLRSTALCEVFNDLVFRFGVSAISWRVSSSAASADGLLTPTGVTSQQVPVASRDTGVRRRRRMSVTNADVANA